MFAKPNELFNFEKFDEYLYFVENNVIKYFHDKDIVKKRFLRANRLDGLCPKINLKTGLYNFYQYAKKNWK